MPDSARIAVLATPRIARRALGLIELLFVLMIIILLLAVMLPALRRARAQAKLAVCLANMTGISKASLNYASDDPSEMLIPLPELQELGGTFEWGGKAGAGQPSSPGRVETSVFGTGAYRGPAHRPLNRYIYKNRFTDWRPRKGEPQPGPGAINYVNDAKIDLAIYHCPSDAGYAGGGFLYTANSRYDCQERSFRDERLSAYDHYGSSYAANALWIVGGEAGRGIRTQSVYMNPVSRVPAPASSVSYLEVPARFAWVWGSWKDSRCEHTDYGSRVEGNQKPISGWHKRNFAFNVVFVDGHASTVEMRGCTRPAPDVEIRSGYVTNRCDAAISDNECIRCVTLRGQGWQLDTLPSVAILTPWSSDQLLQSPNLQVLP